MPVYECGDCGERFRSKDALNSHKEDCTPSVTDREDTGTAVNDLFSGSGLKKLHPSNIAGKLTMQNLALFFGLFLMSTLFLGTASFMMTTSPGGGIGDLFGGTGNVAAQETSPPTGQSIADESDIPQVPESDVPASPVVTNPLDDNVQLHLLIQGGQENQPGALVQYNCPDGCPELEQELAEFVEGYNGWVYTAPNPDLDEPIILTALHDMDRQDEFDEDAAHDFICRNLQNQPLACLE